MRCSVGEEKKVFSEVVCAFVCAFERGSKEERKIDR